MIVKLLSNWNGHSAGETLNLETGAARSLIRGNLAVPAGPPPPSELKAVEAPAEDKMLRRPTAKKRTTTRKVTQT